MTRAARSALALLFATSAAAVGFLEGRALADGRLAPKGWFTGERARAPRPDAATPAPRRPASLRELFVALAELEPPPADANGVFSWRERLVALARLSASHGFSTDLADEEGALRRYVALDSPAEVAAFLDLWSDVAQRAGNAVVRDAATRLAARLDTNPLRLRVRAALLASDRDVLHDLGVESDPADLDALTSALLGAALLRFEMDDDAIEHWRAGALEHPDDPVLHLLLAWALESEVESTEETRAEASRHLAAALALLPESEALHKRLSAANR